MKKIYRKEWFIILIALAVGILFLFVPRIFTSYPDLSEKYSTKVFPVLSRPVTFITSLCPLSLTEIFVVFTCLTALFWLFLVILRFRHSDDRKRTAFRFFSVLTVLFAVLSASFTLMLGIQYT